MGRVRGPPRLTGVFGVQGGHIFLQGTRGHEARLHAGSFILGSPGTSYATVVLEKVPTLATNLTLPSKPPGKLCSWGWAGDREAGIHTIAPLSKLFFLPSSRRE